MKRMRVKGWLVQPVIVMDDGDELDDVELQAQFIKRASWDEFVTGGWKAGLEQLRAQLEVPDDAQAQAPCEDMSTAASVPISSQPREVAN